MLKLLEKDNCPYIIKAIDTFEYSNRQTVVYNYYENTLRSYIKKKFNNDFRKVEIKILI